MTAQPQVGFAYRNLDRSYKKLTAAAPQKQRNDIIGTSNLCVESGDAYIPMFIFFFFC